MNNLQPDRIGCSLWDACTAPLCPLRSNDGVWLADEPVCTSRKHGAGLRWVKVQRRIARLGNVIGHFTLSDLQSIRKVRAGIRGHNPDVIAACGGNGAADAQPPARGPVSTPDAARGDSDPCRQPKPPEPRISAVPEMPSGLPAIDPASASQ